MTEQAADNYEQGLLAPDWLEPLPRPEGAWSWQQWLDAGSPPGWVAVGVPGQHTDKRTNYD